MLERIQSGEHILGFNIFSSYARAKQKKDPSLEIVYPKDYTLVMSRIAILPKAARHPNASKVFLDYLLSGRGQEIVAHGVGAGLDPDRRDRRRHRRLPGRLHGQHAQAPSR